MFVIGAAVLVGGLLWVQALTVDLRATVAVTAIAMDTVEDTVALAGALADGASDAINSASDAAADTAAATSAASAGMVDLSSFLEVELSSNIEAIRQALPGAIGAATAIDSTLGALSFVGLDYSPDEPFADSLRRIQSALDELPEGIREQSEVLTELGPISADMASGVAALAGDLGELTSTLGQMDELTDQYSSAVAAADAAVTETANSLNTTMFLLRVVVVITAAGAVLVGVALLSVDRIVGLLVSEDDLDRGEVVVAVHGASTVSVDPE